jgi:hypothetical protein
VGKSFIKLYAEGVVQMKICALSVVRQNVKYFPFLFLRVSLTGIQTEYSVQIQLQKQQSLYRPGVAQGVPGNQGSQIT